MYIRGSPLIQNKVLLDGMLIYNAFHSIGLFSVFDSDAMSNADVYTGLGKYGGRISSVMDIRTRDGNMRETEGRVGASPFGVKLLVHGPLKAMSEDQSGGISYLLSVNTVTWSSLRRCSISTSGRALALWFHRRTANSPSAVETLKLSLFGFNFNDNASVLDDSTADFANYGWRNVEAAPSPWCSRGVRCC